MPAEFSTQASPLKGRRVTVAGLGLHGGAVGTVQWLRSQGAKILVTDLKTASQLELSLKKLGDTSDLQLELGQHRLQDFTDTDLVIRNPSVPRGSEFLSAARAAGVTVAMDSSLFFEHSPTGDIIGVTGSKGKTTTANAIYKILTCAQDNVVAAGLDGISPLAQLDKVNSGSVVVFELSSWRLEALDNIRRSPQTAVVTSIYREHLNTYDSFEDYINTKKTIIKYQAAGDMAILNADDAILSSWTNEARGRVLWYSLGPLSDADGIYIKDGAVRLCNSGKTVELMETTDLPLQAQHERRNLLPGILIAHLRGIDLPVIRQALKTIVPLPHRLEEVGSIENIVFINDSAATMPDATIAAIDAFPAKPLVLILGGSDKNLSFDLLGSRIARADIKAIIWLPGTATAAMKKACSSPGEIIEQDATNMDDAVQKAGEVASSGDIVLLSPGATSFGLFLHEFDRGDKFRQAVAELLRRKR